MPLVNFQISIDTATGEIRFKPVGESVMEANGSGKSCTDAVREYLEWGRNFGGKEGRPWNKFHGSNVAKDLREWMADPTFPATVEKLSPQIVEAHLKAMAAATKQDAENADELLPRYAPKTVADRFTSLKSFVNWCVRSKYLAESPIERCVKPNGRVIKRTRTLTYLDYRALCAVAPAYRQTLYRVAVQTAFRKGEMEALLVEDLDAAGERIWLRAESEKTRQDHWFPITAALAALLSEHVKAAGLKPKDALLRVNSSPIQEFDKDCERAGIDKKTADGTIDFHGLRRTAISWFEDAGATEGQIRAFGRHSVKSTTQRYRRPKLDDIRAVMSRVEKGLHGSELKVMEDTGIEPVTFRLPAGSQYSSDVNLNTFITSAYMLSNEQERRQFLALSEGVFRRKYGGN